MPCITQRSRSFEGAVGMPPSVAPTRLPAQWRHFSAFDATAASAINRQSERRGLSKLVMPFSAPPAPRSAGTHFPDVHHAARSGRLPNRGTAERHLDLSLSVRPFRASNRVVVPKFLPVWLVLVGIIKRLSKGVRTSKHVRLKTWLATGAVRFIKVTLAQMRMIMACVVSTCRPGVNNVTQPRLVLISRPR